MRDRTADLNAASVALSQLSYGPILWVINKQGAYYAPCFNLSIQNIDSA